jgi:hypothetical protein
MEKSVPKDRKTTLGARFFCWHEKLLFTLIFIVLVGYDIYSQIERTQNTTLSI